MDPNDSNTISYRMALQRVPYDEHTYTHAQRPSTKSDAETDVTLRNGSDELSVRSRPGSTTAIRAPPNEPKANITKRERVPPSDTDTEIGPTK